MTPPAADVVTDASSEPPSSPFTVNAVTRYFHVPAARVPVAISVAVNVDPAVPAAVAVVTTVSPVSV